MNLRKSKAFRALKEIWYKKLKENGFKDIEKFDARRGEDIPALWHAFDFNRKSLADEPDKFAIKQDYYLRCHHFLNSHGFESETDLRIWEMHSEGHGLRRISKSLAEKGYKFSKDKVAKVIHRLKEAMREATTECKNETSLLSDLE